MSAGLLSELDALRDRARDDRRAYAFPLFLFGGLILLSPLVYVPRYVPLEWFNQGIGNDTGPFPQFVPNFAYFLEYPELIGWYWMVTIVGGLWLSSWWYRRQARLRGVETDVRVPIAAAAAALVGFLLWEPMLSILLRETVDFNGLYSTPAVNLPILFGSAASSAVVFFLARRATDWARTAAVFAGTFLATVAFGAIGVYLLKGYAALLVIGVALAVLARWERSVLLLAISLVFLAVSVPSNIMTMYDQPSPAEFDPRPLAFFSVLAPGAVLLAGGVLAVIRNRR